MNFPQRFIALPLLVAKLAGCGDAKDVPPPPPPAPEAATITTDSTVVDLKILRSMTERTREAARKCQDLIATGISKADEPGTYARFTVDGVIQEVCSVGRSPEISVGDFMPITGQRNVQKTFLYGRTNADRNVPEIERVEGFQAYILFSDHVTPAQARQGAIPLNENGVTVSLLFTDGLPGQKIVLNTGDAAQIRAYWTESVDKATFTGSLASDARCFGVTALPEHFFRKPEVSCNSVRDFFSETQSAIQGLLDASNSRQK